MNRRFKPTFVEKVVAFDIETTSYTDDGEKRAIVYSYCVQVEDHIKIMRTSHEFLSYMSKIIEDNNASFANRVVVYVHNLAYEWQFIKHLFEWDTESVFCNGNERNVIRAATVDGLEFRCSLALTNAPLKTVGDMVGVPKLVGDLDYSKLRHSETPLTPEELEYIKNDTRIIVAAIRDRLKVDGFDTIPMTKTGYVRREMRQIRNGRHKSAADYRKTMGKLMLTPETYTLSRDVFSGGYTHANGNINGQALKGVVAYDLGSSYPSALAQFRYPMGQFLRVPNINSNDEFLSMLNKLCCIVDITLNNIESRTSFPPISESKTKRLTDPVTDNGRLWSATSVRVLCTDVDLLIYLRAYKVESYTVNSMWVADPGYLPTSFVEGVLNYYAEKTTLKGVAGAEELYRLAKENVNAIYGMVATDPYRTEFVTDFELNITSVLPSLCQSITKHNNDKKRFLYYPWGAWCTAYARFILQTTILDLEAAGVTVAYCDTDSVYAVDHPAISGIIEGSNNDITTRLNTAAKHHGWSDERAAELLSPSDKNGHVHPLGIWESETETPLDEFKTLGAKRYAKREDGTFKLTVAGLNKKQAAEYIEANGGMDFFAPDMTIPASNSGRVVHSYSEGTAHNYLTDYLGNVSEVFQRGFIHLEPTSYHMALSSEYDSFLEALFEGRL